MREKILRCLNSSDLSNEEWENAAHIIASLGAAQIGSRKQLSIGAHLLHIKAGHVQFIPRVLVLLAHQIASKARRNNWAGVGRHNAYLIAQIALDRYLDVLCKPCNGVGKIGDFGQVIVICQTCKGSGKRKDNDVSAAEDLGMSSGAFRGFEMSDRLKELVSLLDRMEALAASATRKQARGTEQ